MNLNTSNDATRNDATRQRAQALAQRLLEIGRECASLPVLDARSPEEMLYDDSGLPRGEEAELTEARQAAPATLGKAWADELREFHGTIEVRKTPTLSVEQILEQDRSDRV